MSYLVSDIERAVCRKYALSKEQLRSPTRVRAIARPRQIMMFLARQETKASYPQIGRHLGGRDHTTILYGNRKIIRMMRETNTMAGEVEEVREVLQRLTPQRAMMAQSVASTALVTERGVDA